MTARAHIHRLVDALPDDALDSVERVLAEYYAPPEDRPALRPTDAAEERLHNFFRRYEGRSLADELIAERRKEARRESS